MEEQRDLEEELGWNEIGTSIIGVVTGSAPQTYIFPQGKW